MKYLELSFLDLSLYGYYMDKKGKFYKKGSNDEMVPFTVSIIGYYSSKALKEIVKKSSRYSLLV